MDSSASLRFEDYYGVGTALSYGANTGPNTGATTQQQQQQRYSLTAAPNSNEQSARQQQENLLQEMVDIHRLLRKFAVCRVCVLSVASHSPP